MEKLQAKIAECKANIFDLDGTLVNLEELNYQSYRQVVVEHFSLSLDYTEYQKYFSGTKTALGFELFLKSKNILFTNSRELVSDFRKIKEDSLVHNPDQVMKIIPFAYEFLNQQKKLDMAVVLATSTIRKFTMLIVEHFKLQSFFDFIISAEDVVHGKPAPDIYNVAVMKLKIPKAEVVVFEDSESGIASAKSAGLSVVCIHTQGLNDSAVSRADFVIKDYSEILKK